MGKEPTRTLAVQLPLKYHKAMRLYGAEHDLGNLEVVMRAIDALLARDKKLVECAEFCGDL